jgi:predicted acylesterase/phospholipase RssA
MCLAYSPGKICRYILAISLAFSLATPAMAEELQRLSFAISGGASKGAYEAGINWAGLTILRHEGDRTDPVLKGRVRPYEAASLAGASAGGINTLLSGMTWCVKPEREGGFPNRINDNIFRNVWLMPDINTLLPPDPESPAYRQDDAVLARQSLIEASNYLRSYWKQPIFRPGCHIPLGVTVTRTTPEVIQVGDVDVKNQRFTIPFELRVQRDGTVAYYFDPNDYSAQLDYSMILLPTNAGDPDYQISDERIQQAVLTTSAYPIAFGRKRIKFCRVKALYEDETEVPGIEQTELKCPVGYELSEAEFADGGLFDNLPIGLARTLAEDNVDAQKNPFPVTYVYIDPNRLRYKVPEKLDFEACHGDHPPKACREMEYSFISESNLVTEALGTARNYELYRELTGEAWAHNLSQLSLEMAGLMEKSGARFNCSDALPFFDKPLNCSHALRLAGRFMTVAYNRKQAPITTPFSVEKLKRRGLLKNCVMTRTTRRVPTIAECEVDYRKYRGQLANGMLAIVKRMPDKSAVLENRIQNARYSLHNDRVIRVTSRGAPITSELLGAFAAFLDKKFREYDYYVGIYDAIVIFTHTVCAHHFTPKDQPEEYRQCREEVAERYYKQLGLQNDAKGRYVFALLAKWEFGKEGALSFAYTPMPEEERDMHIIHDGLQSSLQARWRKVLGIGQTRPEIEFFLHLKQQGFRPSPSRRGGRPLLADILDDPEYWSFELARRVTERLIILEQRADEIFAGREPDPNKRPMSSSVLIGGAAYALRSATFKYQPFEFAPSTAPRYWRWRNLIPYELAFDLVEGRGHFVWQPTWALSRSNILGLRITVPVTGNLVVSSTRVNYYALGLDYTYLTGKYLISGFGFTPGYYHNLDTISGSTSDTVGADIHVGVLKNKLRLALGVRDLGSTQNTWFIQVSLTDLPGIAYWLSR